SSQIAGICFTHIAFSVLRAFYSQLTLRELFYRLADFSNILLELWELNWQSFTQMLSRQSADPIDQESRERLLAVAKQTGYISDYRGVRASSTGKRFWIENVTLWNVLNEQQQPCGQAATFTQWQFIKEWSLDLT
ncbi:MAG: MEKHLA domain-containing protein, partial [Timaviella obliquedivisa GSE-PSE-MK23-08B]|nr:MEKHLA domain-containing protein [Timaviella obliquedivisa GSE-PSE-MK23-08B]